MNHSKKLIFSTLSLLTLLFLAACSNSANQSQTSQESSSASTSTSAASSATSSSAASSSSNGNSSSETESATINGTYQGTDEDGDSITLEINGETGTWTEVEKDGEKEIKQVSLDLTSQRITIDDDVERYFIDGNQLTIEDITQENGENDTIVLTKQ